MVLRTSRILLVAAVALFYTLVLFNNLTDYGSNYIFVHHVLLMDTTFPGNHGLWRAIHPIPAQVVFYDGIIAWEAAVMAMLWIGAVALLRARRKTAVEFDRAKRTAIAALTLGLLLWFCAFITIGGEWFLMWQSKLWNGQDAAARMFETTGLVLLLLALPEREAQP
jgi:predicted small integral membrane protein